jgi:hypothetical protein
MGILVFLGVLLVITQEQQPNPAFISYVAVGFAGLAIIGHYFFRLPINSQGLKAIRTRDSFDPQSDDVFFALAPTYQVEHIIKMAIIEGAAFLNGVAYMLEKHWWNLAVMGLIVFLMLIRFPSHSKITAWIERRTLRLQFGDSNS